MRNKDYPLYDLPVRSSLADMLEANAREIPDRIAIRQRAGKSGIEEISFRQLAEDVRKAAACIRKTFGTGRHIALIGENSYEWLLAFFGAVCSGNVAVPTDKELPAAEIHDLLRSADVTAAIVSKTYSDLVEEMTDLQVMTLKQLRNAASEGADEDRLPDPDPEATAVIFFTSGTTGKSKCVMLSHGNIISEINLSSRVVDVQGQNTVALLPFNHAYGLVLAILSMMNMQKSTFIVKSLKNMQKDIQEGKPDIIMLVPLFVETFYKKIKAGIREQGKEAQFQKGLRLSRFLLRLGIDRRRQIFHDVLDIFGGNLKWIVSGGAPLEPVYVREFRNFGIGVLNGYGITECSPCVAVNRNYHYKDDSAGRLLPGIEARSGAGGELEIRGPVVMQGYYKNREATEEVFTEDGWFRTGDLGYVDEDRFIHLTGRAKNLIILSNGENISPEELESDFQRDEGVCEVLVYAEQNKLVAEIYPEEAFRGNEEYFRDLMQKVNEGRPLSKQIAAVKLRDTEFIKNTVKKIVRTRNIPK